MGSLAGVIRDGLCFSTSLILSLMVSLQLDSEKWPYLGTGEPKTRSHKVNDASSCLMNDRTTKGGYRRTEKILLSLDDDDESLMWVRAAEKSKLLKMAKDPKQLNWLKTA